MKTMSGFTLDTHAFDVEYEKDAISGFLVHLDKIDLMIRAFENKEADKRTSTALLVWLAKNATEIAELLRQNGSKHEGRIEVNIFPLSGFAGAVGDKFPYGGLTLDEFKAEVVKYGVKTMLGPKEIYLVVRDDLETEYFKDNNSMEQIVFASTVFSLLLLTCGMDGKKATNVSRDFSFARVPLTPKIHTHALAMALIGAKQTK